MTSCSYKTNAALNDNSLLISSNLGVFLESWTGCSSSHICCGGSQGGGWVANHRRRTAQWHSVKWKIDLTDAPVHTHTHTGTESGSTTQVNKSQLCVTPFSDTFLSCGCSGGFASRCNHRGGVGGGATAAHTQEEDGPCSQSHQSQRQGKPGVLACN